MNEIQLITVPEAARRLGVSRATAYRLVAAGELQVVDLSRKGALRPMLRVRTDHLMELIQRRTLNAA